MSTKKESLLIILSILKKLVLSLLKKWSMRVFSTV